MNNITGSLVLFNNNPIKFELAIMSFLSGCSGFLYIIDNSSPPLNHELFQHERVIYIHSGVNLGFGKAHNLVLSYLMH